MNISNTRARRPARPPGSIVRWPLFGRRARPIRAARLVQLPQQQTANSAHFIKLPPLFIDLFIQALDHVFQADQLEFYLDKTLFHCGFARHLLKGISVIPYQTFMDFAYIKEAQPLSGKLSISTF